MANGGAHTASTRVSGRLARRTHCPKTVSSQVTQAVIPSGLPFYRRVELRGATLVLVGSTSCLICQSPNLPISQFCTACRPSFDIHKPQHRRVSGGKSSPDLPCFHVLSGCSNAVNAGRRAATPPVRAPFARFRDRLRTSRPRAAARLKCRRLRRPCGIASLLPASSERGPSDGRVPQSSRWEHHHIASKARASSSLSGVSVPPIRL